MATKKISGYTEKTTYADDDLFLIEQAAGSYRKFSSSRLTRVIRSNIILTIGSGGDYATYKAAMDYLRDKWIMRGATVTLQQISDLAVSSSSDYNYTDCNCVLYMSHPCSRRIEIDLNGCDIVIGAGDTTVIHGLICSSGSYLKIYSSLPGSVIRNTNTGVESCGIHLLPGSVFQNSTSSANYITLGASTYGFSYGFSAENGLPTIIGYIHSCYNGYGFLAYYSSVISAEHVDVSDNSTGGFYAYMGGNINRSGCTGSQATNTSPALDTVGNYNSFIH